MLPNRLNFRTMARRSATPPEVHVFLIWHNALDHAADILTHVERRFRVLDVVDIEWSRTAFAQSLTLFYRDTLPPGSEKERHCGVRPFRLLVVNDPDPRYDRRHTSRGRALVNARMFDARRKYRAWTGGGHRVHASLTAREAEHDLFLLLGRRGRSYGQAGAQAGPPSQRREVRELLGANGWEGIEQLLTALEVTVAYVVLPASTPQSNSLDLLVENDWMAAVTANATPSAEDSSRYIVKVDDADIELRLRSPEGDPSREVWLRDVLQRRLSTDGGYVPNPVDGAYIRL